MEALLTETAVIVMNSAAAFFVGTAVCNEKIGLDFVSLVILDKD